MSDKFNSSSMHNDHLLSHKYETDKLISPKEQHKSPNVSIFSSPEQLRKNNNPKQLFSPMGIQFENYDAENDVNQHSTTLNNNRLVEQMSSKLLSLNQLNQIDDSSCQSPQQKVKYFEMSAFDKIDRKKDAINSILPLDGNETMDKTNEINLIYKQRSQNSGIFENNEQNISNKRNLNKNESSNIVVQKINKDNNVNSENDNKLILNNINSQENVENNINLKQTVSKVEFQRKESNISNNTYQKNTPVQSKRNLKSKKNLTNITNHSQNSTPMTPIKIGNKNRIFPSINGTMNSLHLIPESSQYQNKEVTNSIIGNQKSLYNSMRKSQRLINGTDLAFNLAGQQHGGAMSPASKGQILFSYGTLNTQNVGFDKKAQFFPQSQNTNNELILQSGGFDFLKKWNIATRVKMINRFFQKVKNQTSQINFKYLKKSHFDLIDDHAYFYQNENNSRLSKSHTIVGKFISFLYFLIRKLPILSPNATPIRYWRLFYTFVLLVQMFLIPFQISFSIVFNSGQEAYLLYYSPLVIYCLNIFIQLNTGYYEMGVEQLNRLKVFENYKLQFCVDIIVIIAFTLTNTLEKPYFNVFFCLKYHQLSSYFQDIVEYYKIQQKFSYAYTLAKLAFLILFIAHACGCIFQLISQAEISEGNDDTWLVQNNLSNKSIEKRYLNSLYFSIITMITVGYGDIKPIADSEKMFIIFMTLLGSVVFGYVVNTIGGIFQEIAQKKANFMQKKYDLSIYMTARQIKQEIQLRVMKYLDYMRMQEEDNPMRGEYLLEQISENLKDEIKRDFYGRILQSAKMFQSKFSTSFLNAVSIHFYEKVLGPGEIIFHQQSSGENDIYYVLKGQVEIFLQSGVNSRHISYIKQGYFFGQGGFFSSAPRESSAKSTSSTHVLVLPQNKFLEVIKDFTPDFETYCQIKDEMVIYNKKESMACLSCGKYNHSLINCHYIHYRRNRDLMVARYTYSVPNERKGYNRIQKNFNCLKMNNSVRFNLKKLRQDVFDRIYEELQQDDAEDDTEKKLNIQYKINLVGISQDKKFFKKAKKIKYVDQKIILYSDDEDQDSSLGEIAECSYYSNQNQQSGFQKQYQEDEISGEDESDSNEEDNDSENELLIEQISKKSINEDVLNSIQEIDEDNNDQSKKHSLNNRTSFPNINSNKLTEFMINIQKEGIGKHTDSIKHQESSMLGISSLSPSLIETSSDFSDQDSFAQNNKSLLSEGSQIERTTSIKRFRSESTPNNLLLSKKSKSGTSLQPSITRENSASKSKSKKIKNLQQQKKEKESESQLIIKQSSKTDISSLNLDGNKLQNDDHVNRQKSKTSFKQSKSNRSIQDELNQKLSEKDSDLMTISTKKRKNISQSSRNITINQSNPTQINQTNSQLAQQMIKGNLLKQFNVQNNQIQIISNNQETPNREKATSITKKRNLQNDTIGIKNQLVTFQQQQNTLDESSSSKKKSKRKIINNDTDILINHKKNINKNSQPKRKQNQLEFNLFHNDQSQELPNLEYQYDDFNVNSLSNILMIQHDHSNQNDQSFNSTSRHKKEQTEIQKKSPRKVILNGFFNFGLPSQEEDDQANNKQELKLFQQIGSEKRSQVHQENPSQNQILDANSNINAFNNKNVGQNQKLKNKQLLRAQSYKSLKSKANRGSKLISIQEIEELISSRNKLNTQMDNNSVRQKQELQKVSSNDWNSPILKNINGFMNNNINHYDHDQEKSFSAGGMNSPSLSYHKGGFQQNNNFVFSNNNKFEGDIDVNSSRISSQQHTLPQNTQIQQELQLQLQLYQLQQHQQQQQQIQQQQQQLLSSSLIKKSKFAQTNGMPLQIKRTPSIIFRSNQEGENNYQNQQNMLQQAYQIKQQFYDKLSNMEKMRKEQERLRRNSHYMSNKYPLNSVLNSQINGIRLSSDIQSIASHRNSANTYGAQSQLIGNSQNLNMNSNTNNINHHGSTNMQNQGQINDDLLHRLKDLLIQKNQEEIKNNETKRTSNLFGLDQNFYMMNPLYTDYNLFFLPEIDAMKEYDNYFAHNNHSEVLKKYKGIQKSIRRVQKVQNVKRKVNITHTLSILGVGKLE